MLDRVLEFVASRRRQRFRDRVIRALALNRRSEVRRDGLLYDRICTRLEIDWQARDIHPWDRELGSAREARLFAEQCLADVEAALHRLFNLLPEIDLIALRVIDRESLAAILTGSVARDDMNAVDFAPSTQMRLKRLGLKYRLDGWRFEPLRDRSDRSPIDL